MAHIREECKSQALGNTFEALIQNYHDEDYFSTDTDERIDKLVAFGYTGTTAMHSPTLSGTGSGSSQSSVEAPAPFIDLTGGPLERAAKPLDLDQTVTSMDEMPEAPQAEEMPIGEMPTSSKKKKSKQRRKVKREGAAEASTSTPRVPGPKEAAFQEAMDEIASGEDETAL